MIEIPGILSTGGSPAARSIAGTSRFIRYAFMPNRLRYCGGDDNRDLFEYALAMVREPPVDAMLRKFTGALPYLRLIAGANAIADPFDDRVVEAYWIGNELLDRVEVRRLHDALRERFGKQLSPRLQDLVLRKAPAGARAHHSFHVFDIHSRVGEIDNTLETMDQCRVSWGNVLRVEGAQLIVERQPLQLLDGKITLGPAVTERVVRQVDGRGFASTKPGDWVAIHWGWVCEVLTPRQQAQLAHYTRYHLALANQTV